MHIRPTASRAIQASNAVDLATEARFARSAALLRIRAVIGMTGLSRSTIYRLGRAGKFPAGIKLTERTTGWLATEIEAWIEARRAERDLKLAA